MKHYNHFVNSFHEIQVCIIWFHKHDNDHVEQFITTSYQRIIRTHYYTKDYDSWFTKPLAMIWLAVFLDQGLLGWSKGSLTDVHVTDFAIFIRILYVNWTYYVIIHPGMCTFPYWIIMNLLDEVWYLSHRTAHQMGWFL